MLTRDQFDTICKSFIDKQGQPNSPAYTGWSWDEHPTLRRLGYLSRRCSVVSIGPSVEGADSTVEEDIVEVEDPATARVVDSPEAFDVWEYVVFSSTFQVPALMFSVHTKSGSPVSLDGILNTTLFHRPAFVGAEKTTFALQTPNQPFPMLSQAEHPTIGTPCWCLHPCATSEALKELQEADGYENSASPGRLLELWLLLIGNVVDFSQ